LATLLQPCIETWEFSLNFGLILAIENPKKALNLSIFSFAIWLTSKRKAFFFWGQGKQGTSRKNSQSLMEGTSRDRDQLQLHEPKPPNNHSSDQSRKPYSRLLCTHEKATQTHQTNQPTTSAKKS
jgi:hypothetical protein